MAQTYDLTSSIPAATDLRTGDILNCPYSGTYKTITLPKGTYKLECWGAQGGSYNTTYVGGKGGYSYGTLTLTESTVLYLYAGGAGTKPSTINRASGGGFNGGGNAYTTNTNNMPGAGGGGSDIRIKGSGYNNRIIVAGGGGGAHGVTTAYGNGGYGGGTTGGAGESSATRTYTPGAGGTATAAGNSYYGTIANGSSNGKVGGFGFGGAPSASYSTGGGGGWYGGGYARRAGAGGGSGYVYTSSTASQHPNNSNIGSSYYLTDASTKAGNTSFTDYSGSTVTGHEGNGAVRITALSIESNLLLIKTSSNVWSEISKVFMKVSDNEWASIDIGG